MFQPKFTMSTPSDWQKNGKTSKRQLRKLVPVILKWTKIQKRKSLKPAVIYSNKKWTGIIKWSAVLNAAKTIEKIKMNLMKKWRAKTSLMKKRKVNTSLTKKRKVRTNLTKKKKVKTSLTKKRKVKTSLMKKRKVKMSLMKKLRAKTRKLKRKLSPSLCLE